MEKVQRTGLEQVQNSGGTKRTVPFPYEQKRQVQFRSTFRICWVSTDKHKCISLTKLVTISQYIRETLFYCRRFSFLEVSFQILTSVNPKTLFSKLRYRCLFNFFNHKLSPFRLWCINVVNCFEIFCMHFCVFGRIKKLQMLVLGCLKKSKFVLANNIR